MARTNSGTLITGKSGFGKSWFGGALAEESTKQRVILDPKDEHIGLADTKFVFGPAELDASRNMGGTYEFFKRILATGKSVRILIHGLDIKETLEVADGLARAMHERGNLFFFGSEYHRFAPNNQVPKYVQILHTDARTCGIDYIVDTQRPALLDPTVITQANRRVTFKVDYDLDVDRLGPLFNNPDPSRFRDVKQAIRALPQRTCLYINADTSEQVVIDTNKMHRKLQHHG